MKKKIAATPTLAEDALLWASSIGSTISGVSPPVGIVEGVENHRVARQAAAVKAAGKTQATAGLDRKKKPKNVNSRTD